MTNDESTNKNNANRSRRSFLAAAFLSPALAGGAYGLYENSKRSNEARMLPQSKSMGDIEGNPSVRVRTSTEDQSTLIQRPTELSVDPALLEAIGRDVGQQIRVYRSQDEYAIYTIGEISDESDADIVRMSRLARNRLDLEAVLQTATCGQDEEYVCPPDLLEDSPVNAEEGFHAVVDPVVPNRTFSEAEAEREGELVERLDDDGHQSTLVVCAPHGGDIEPYTAEQAERFGSQFADITAWSCKGWRQGGGAFLRWHVPSHRLDPTSFPQLNQIAGRGFEHAVSFHGNCPERVQIGGAAPRSLRTAVRDAIEKALPEDSVSVILAEEPYRAESEDTLVNRLTMGRDNGVWIGQPRAVREGYYVEIADAVAAVYETVL